MIKKFKNLFWKFYSLRDKNYKENFYGSFNLWRIIIINLLKPGRLINRLRFGQLFIYRNIEKLEKKFNKKLQSKDLDIQSDKREKLTVGLKELCDFGGCVLKEYFNEKEISDLIIKNKELINSLKISNELSQSAKIIPLSNELNRIWLDDGILLLLNTFFGRLAYTRNYPHIIYTNVPKNSSEDKYNQIRWADKWHVDHSVLFNVHIVLEDIENNETRMQILKGSHKFFNYGSNFSNNLVEKSNLEKIDCFGKRGTVYFHTGNVVHRIKPELGSERLVLHFEFSPGSNILLDAKGIHESLRSGFDITTVNEQKQKVISPIFPKNLFKGYDFQNNHFRPTKYRGI